MITLAPYQEDIVSWFRSMPSNLRGRIDASEIGAGKTYPAIETADCYPPPRLIVAPAYLLYQWRQELIKYLGEGSTGTIATIIGPPEDKRKCLVPPLADWTLCSYMFLASTHTVKPTITVRGHHIPAQKIHRYPQLLTIPWETIIFDEAHRMRGRNSVATKYAYGLLCKRALLLTGTPIVRNGGDLFPLLRICDPTNHTSYWSFVETWCRIRHTPWQRIVGAVQSPEVFARMYQKYMRVRTLEEVGIDVSKPYDRIIKVQLPASVLKAHREAKKNYFLEHPDLSAPEAFASAGALLSRLRMLTSSPPTEENPKALAALGLLEKHSKRRAVVFCWYNATLRELQSYLRSRLKSRPVLAIFAMDPYEDRQRILKAWLKRQDGILLGTIGTLGTGLDGLQAANVAILYEQHYLESDNRQAIGRLVRRGQTKVVYVYRLQAAHTIDEAVYRIASKRHTNVLAAMLQDLNNEEP